MRHNTFDLSKFVGLNFGAIWMIHGNQAYWTGNQATDNARGGILLELYNNTITVNQGYRIIYLRGGRTVAYDNTFTFLNSSPPIVSPTEEEGYPGDGSPATTRPLVWPAEDQVNNSFFWNNTIDGRAQASTDIVNWQTPQDNTFIRLNRDYFLRPPNSTTATNYPRPGSPSLPNYPASTFYAPVTSYTAVPISSSAAISGLHLTTAPENHTWTIDLGNGAVQFTWWRVALGV